MPYSEEVLDHFNKPRNAGSFEKEEQRIGTGLVGAPSCGDVMKLQIKVDQTGKIEDARFKTFGCGSAIASSSLITEMLKGKTIDEALKIKNSSIAEKLSLPPVKIHCSVLAEDAIRAAVSDYKKKNDNPDLRLSENALAHIHSSLSKRGRGLGVRFSVKKTGCSGYTYLVEYADQENQEDKKMVIDGIVVYVPLKSLPYLSGSTVDFIREGLNEGFKFTNPHAKFYCGCGESFNV